MIECCYITSNRNKLPCSPGLKRSLIGDYEPVYIAGICSSPPESDDRNFLLDPPLQAHEALDVGKRRGHGSGSDALYAYFVSVGLLGPGISVVMDKQQPCNQQRDFLTNIPSITLIL